MFLQCLLIRFLALNLITSCLLSRTEKVDVLVVGGSASGVTAGVQSARMGMNTLLLEETDWLGGMLTSAGVSAIDGNYRLPSGLWGEFKERLIEYYGSLDSLKTGWVSSVLFEPSVGNKILYQMVSGEDKLSVRKGVLVQSVKKEHEGWLVKVKNPDDTYSDVRTKVLIDATELGDIAKMCGVGYDVGMESRSITGEDVAPQEANDIVQDLTYVAILKDYGKDVTIPCPSGYNPNDFACSCLCEYCQNPKEKNRIWSKEMMISYGKLPRGKYMINWPIEGNDYYVNMVDMIAEQRERAIEAAKHHTLCFIYFIQKELGFSHLGIADDEFPTADGLPLIPYHRESRRIHGKVRFTANYMEEPYAQRLKLYRTCVAVGDYSVDHHHGRYQGNEALPNLYFHPVPSFGLPLGTLIPDDVDDLIVAEKSISVSNIANGATRLQPVVMQIGQAAGALAALAIKEQKEIDEVSVRSVQNVLLDSGCYLLPYLDVEKSNPIFSSLQRIGSTGILKSIGKCVGWNNQTWFRSDTLLLKSELEGLIDYYPQIPSSMFVNEPMSVSEAIDLLKKLSKYSSHDIKKRVREIWDQYDWGELRYSRHLLRGEMAVLIDKILDPFNRFNVNIEGKLITNNN